MGVGQTQLRPLQPVKQREAASAAQSSTKFPGKWAPRCVPGFLETRQAATSLPYGDGLQEVCTPALKLLSSTAGPWERRGRQIGSGSAA